LGKQQVSFPACPVCVVRRPFQKSCSEKHLDRELRFHLEQQIAD
jgi:hypothetical protein